MDRIGFNGNNLKIVHTYIGQSGRSLNTSVEKQMYTQYRNSNIIQLWELCYNIDKNRISLLYQVEKSKKIYV